MALRDPNKIGIGARWEEEVFAVLPDGEVVWSDGENEYQGSESVIAKLDDGRWLFYSWSYGSCSGCDHWEADGGLEQEVAAEAAAPTATMEPEAFRDYLIACKATDAQWIRKLDWPMLPDEIAVKLGAR